MLGNKNLAYGEITFETFIKILYWIETTTDTKINGVFYDLGHGAGKGIVCAGLANRFSKICGVELLEVLYYESLRMIDK